MNGFFVLACLTSLSSSRRTPFTREASGNFERTRRELKPTQLDALRTLLLLSTHLGGVTNFGSRHQRASHSDISMSGDDVRTNVVEKLSIGRRALIAGTASSVVFPFIAEAADQLEGMKTSESYTNLQQISPGTVGTLGAGTMSSRSRPATGIVLLEDAQTSGSVDAPFIEAELILDGGIAANVGFQAEKGYPIARGMFYDIEAKSKNTGRAASVLLNVVALPEGKKLADVKDDFITSKVFSTSGRFGAYGPPSVIKKSKDADGLIDVSFSTLSPSGRDSMNRALISAIQPERSRDAVVMIATTSNKNFKDEETAFRKMLASLRVSKVRPTKLERSTKNDFRFEERGGLSKSSNGEADID